MTTDKQTAANRRNAQLSTGPRTEAGKRRSRMNALKHGLRSGLEVLPGEDAEQLDNLRESLREACQPANALEEVLVAQMVDAEWRRRRYNRCETGLFYYRYCVADPPFDIAKRIAPEPPSSPEERMSFRYGKMTQYLTSEEDFIGSLGRYEASTRRAFFQALRAFIGQRQFMASHRSPSRRDAPAALPLPARKQTLPNEPILEQVPIKPTA